MANSWTSAETNLLAYLLTQLGDTEDVTGFVGEYPGHFADETVDHMWFVAITGGGTPDDVGAGVAYCGMNAKAVWDGVYTSRADAQADAIAIKNLLPLAVGTVTNLSDLRLESEPEIERAIVQRDPDQESAGHVRVWRVIVPMTCIVTGS